MSTAGVEEQVSTEQTAPLTENTAPAGNTTEVDFDRVLAGDEEYIKATNDALGAGTTAVEPEPTQEVKSEKAVAAAPVADQDEVVETITYRGQEVPVKRSQMKDLLQKGRHLEQRLEEVSPLLALAREVPELQEKLRTPEGRKQVIERIRQQEKAQDAGEDIPEVEGYDKDDVRAVDKILQARMKALGIVPPEQADRPSKEQIAARENDERELSSQTRITLQSLRSVDPHYEENMALLKEVVAEVERTTPPEQFRQFYNVVNDPRIIDQSTGRPAFLNFYADVAKERERRASLNTPAAPVVPHIPRKAQVSTGMLSPGSAVSPAANVSAGVLKFESQDAFDRAFNEALSRG